MKFINGLFSRIIVINLMAAWCILALWPAIGSTHENNGKFAKEVKVKPPANIAYKNYTDLSELVSALCDEANLKFKNFYGPGPVRVGPFITVGKFQTNKKSELGVILADQMFALINNDSLMSPGHGQGKMELQRLDGILMECDGYLRVHITGVNNRGQRVSYVTNVEISEPIYRALHTFL